eukprot:757151-Hanusia_phi.AAC.2
MTQPFPPYTSNKRNKSCQDPARRAAGTLSPPARAGPRGGSRQHRAHNLADVRNHGAILDWGEGGKREGEKGGRQRRRRRGKVRKLSLRRERLGRGG